MSADHTGALDAARTLHGIWADVLERSEIGPDDDLFRIGGHSLHALKIATAIRRTFGVKVHLINVYENRTMREQLALLDQAVAPAPGVAPADRPESR